MSSSLSTSVSNRNLNQPFQAPIPEPVPVRETASKYPAQNSLAAAQEPVPRAPAHIPVAVSESESPVQAQRQNETIARNAPMKTERRYPARWRKAPDRRHL